MITNLFWNCKESRLRAFWRQIIQLLLFALLAVVFGYIIPYGLTYLLIVLSIVLHVLFHISGSPLFQLLQLFQLPQASLIGASAALLSAWICIRFFNRESLSPFGFRFSKVWWIDFFFRCVLGVLLNAGVFLVEWLFGGYLSNSFFSMGLPCFPLL